MRKVPFYVQTLIAMGLGTVVGALLGPRADGLGLVGKAVIQIIKTFATPLLFFSVLDSLLRASFRGRGVAALFLVCAINAAFAIAIGLTITNILRPGDHLPWQDAVATIGGKFEGVKETNLLKGLLGHVPENVLSPFLNHSIPGAVILALLIGAGLLALRRENPSARYEDTVAWFASLCLKTLEWAVRLIPFAVFAVVTESVGKNGLTQLRGLGFYAVTAIIGMTIQIALVYQTWILFSGIGLGRFWRASREAVVYALGVNSSLATLPLTLRALDKMGVRPASARLAACVGTNLNNDGILLYEAFAMLFIAQACGVEMTIGQQLMASLTCVVAAFGVAGVPEAGVIALSLVLTTVGLPIEILPLLLTVDWVVARCRSVTNVLGDLTVAVAIDKLAPPPPEPVRA